jgi:hypothetical protein
MAYAQATLSSPSAGEDGLLIVDQRAFAAILKPKVLC